LCSNTSRPLQILGEHKMPKRPRTTPNKTIPELYTEFWDAPDDALLGRNITAAAVGHSMGWMELKAVTGGGIPYYKCGRRCLYRKSDTLIWLKENSKRVNSTSEYTFNLPCNV